MVTKAFPLDHLVADTCQQSSLDRPVSLHLAPSSFIDGWKLQSFCRFVNIRARRQEKNATSRFTGPPRCFLLNIIINTLMSKTGLMVARAAALRTKINIDGCPHPTKKRWRTSSKARPSSPPCYIQRLPFEL